MQKKNNPKAFLYLAPALIVLAIFTIYPLIKTIIISFMVKYNPWTTSGSTFTGWGLGNYTYIFKNKSFLQAIKNTSIYVVFVVPVSVLLSLCIAVLINNTTKGKGFFQTIYFLPYVTSTIAIGLVWKWIFNENSGLLNYILSWFGVEKIAWLSDKRYMLPSLIIFSIWKSLAFNILIFLAGLQNISQEYYNAAKIDSTPKWRVFTKITVPLLSPMILYAFIMGFIGAFKVYNEVVALFGANGVTGDYATTMVYYIYDQFYNNHRFGIAAAGSVVLFLITLLLTFVQTKVAKNKVHY